MDTKALTRVVTFIVIIIAILSLIGIAMFKESPTILQGEIESPQTKISGKLLGRVEAFYVQEGEYVDKGDTLVLINSPETKALMQSASAMRDIASYQNQKVDAGARDQIIASLKEAWLAAKAQAELAYNTNKRVERLYLDSVVTLQRRDEAYALFQSAQALEAAAKYQYEMALEGAQKEDKESAKAMVNAATGDLMAVQALINDTYLTAPQEGEVGSIYPSLGELVMPGTPIMEIINTDSCYAVFNIKEDLIPHFKIGSNFNGRVPALSNATILFKVFYMSPLGSFANWHSSRDNGSYNIVTFQIKASPVNDESNTKNEIKDLRPGMSVLVEL